MVREKSRNFLLSCSRFPLLPRGPYRHEDPSEGKQPLDVARTAIHVAAHYNILDLLDGIVDTQGTVEAPRGTQLLNERTQMGNGSVLVAASQGHEEALQWLFKFPNVDVEAKNFDAVSAVFAALSLKDKGLACFQALIAFPGTDINAKGPKTGRTPLIFAVRNHHLNAVRSLLQIPSLAVNDCDYEGKTAVIHASASGDLTILRHLLAHPDIDINAIDRKGHPALVYALSQDTMLELLGQEGIATTCCGMDGRTPLHFAADRHWDAAVARLLEFPEVDVNAQDTDGKTPLMMAVYEEMALRLLAVPDIDVNRKCCNGQTALMRLCANGFPLVVRRVLELPGVDVNAIDEDGNTALRYVFSEVNMLQLLAVPGIEINWRSPSSLALHKACENGWVDAVRRLLEFPQLDINAMDNNGDVALLKAASEEVALQLLAAPGIDFNAKEANTHQTPLMKAVQFGWTEAIRRLAQLPVEINAMDEMWRSALLHASTEPHVLSLLLVPGISVNVKDYNGETPLIKASRMGFAVASRRLLEFSGIEINAIDSVGMTALSHAATDEVALCLLDAPGIAVGMKDAGGRTALMHASSKGLAGAVSRMLQFPEVEVNAADADGQTALVHAYTDEVALCLLHAPNIDIHAKSNARWTPLMQASSNGQVGALQCMLEYPDIEVNAGDHLGRTALMHASTDEVALLLLNAPNIDVNARAFDGRIGVMEASLKGLTGGVRRMLEFPEIEINVVDNYGKTALLEASTAEIFLYLLDAPTLDVSAEAARGPLALINAVKKGFTDVVRRFLEFPEFLQVINDEDGSNHSTALTVACREGHVEIVRLLLDSPGIDVNARSNNGRTSALQCAAIEWNDPQRREACKEIERLLLAFPGIEDNDDDDDG